MGSINPNLIQSRAGSWLYFLQNQLKIAITSIIMPNVKLTYFNLKARGEPCRLLLAYGGIKYMYASESVDKAVLAKFPKLANLVERVGNVPNIKAWVESRPKTDL